MVAPIDYSLNVKSPFEAAVEGMKFGQVYSEGRRAQDAAQAKQAADAQMQADIADAMGDPMKLAQLGVKYPSLSEPTKRAWEMMDKDKRAAATEEGWAILAALRSGNIDVVKSMLSSKAEAMRNSGNEPMAKAYEDSAKIAEIDPMLAADTLSFLMPSVDDNFSENYERLIKLPSVARQEEAKAVVAEEEAKAAPQKRVMELEKAGWDIEKIKSDIETNRSNARIYALNAQIARETNQLKREELQGKLMDAERERDKAVAERAYEAENAVKGIETTVQVITDIKKDMDSLRAATGASAWRGSMWGSEARSAAAKIEQLQNSIASVNLDKLKGAMSDKDIMFLKTMAASLDRYQDEDSFLSELNRIEKAMTDALPNVRRKFGMPAAGGAIVVEY